MRSFNDPAFTAKQTRKLREQASMSTPRSFSLAIPLVLIACSGSVKHRTDTASTPAPPVVVPAPVIATPLAETSADSAVAIITEYYSAINQQRYGDAYTLWSDSGRASGKSLSEFKHGFTDTRHVDVQTGSPGRIEPAAGSRYITVPVTITATTTSGAAQRFTGTYNLRRSVVDGATADQRAWRIYSAEIH